MIRAVRFTLTVGAVSLVCACRSDSLNPPIGQPQASFSDGAHSGNPDFFFLPPIFQSPVNDPNFERAAFNADVRPTVEICELTTTTPRTCRTDVPLVKSFAASEVRLDAANQQYHVNWDTKSSNLVMTKEYRIRVVLGTHDLGWADVDPVATGAGLKNVETAQFIGLVDGRTLPIKFRIEDGAACDGGDCDSKTIDLGQGGSVVLESSTDRVDIPAQASGQVVTVTVKLCNGLAADLPAFGNCLTVTADPPLSAALSPPAIVSICSLHDDIPSLEHAQQDLVTLHRQDIRDGQAVITALPHARDFCSSSIGQAPPARNWLEASWRTVRHNLATLFGPGQLHAATTTMLDVGGGGESPDFSDFQFLLPAKMQIVTAAVQDVVANSNVPVPPKVLVTDAENRPVGGARVQYHITSTSGGTIVPSDGVVLSDPETGIAALTSWHVGDPGTYTVNASGFGIADPVNNGPGEGFDPFAPPVSHGDPDEDEAQAEVAVGRGNVTFTARSFTQLSGYEVVGGDVINLAARTGFYTNSVICPAGKVVLGGGAAVVGEGAGDFNTRLQESSPGTIGGGARDVWLVSIKNEDASAHNIQILAICATRPAGYEVVSGPDVALGAGGGFNRQSVVCPAGKSVLAGGVLVIGEGSGDFNTRLQESAPGTVGGGAQGAWAVSIKNLDANAHTVRATALCMPQPFGYEAVTSPNIPLTASGGFAQQTVLCPVGKSVLGGGASVIGEGSADFNTRLQESTPGTIGGGARDLWLTSMKNEDGSAHTMSIRASCAVVLRTP